MSATNPDDQATLGDQATTDVGDEPEGVPFLVVGVGASAGGLEAYTELLEGLSASPGLALLLVSHLDPERKSLLAPILARASQMPVLEVTEGMAIRVDHVYVIPPGTNMALTDGHLTLTPRPPRPVPHMPIDHLLRSLAEIQKSRSAGVILSGGGSDGVIAFQSIKAAGGVTFAQSEESALYPSMPRAAAQDGNVDHILRPSEIGRELERIARHPYATTAPDPTAPAAPVRLEADPVADIVNLIRQRTTVDFTHYKQTTIRRRVLRRMALRNIADPAEYLRQLRADAGEVEQLYQDFLIRVTQFFRNPESFEALKAVVFPALVNGRAAGSTIRIWVAGCATGEEAYSIGMSLIEYLDERNESYAIKILATDLNDVALERARAGAYLDNIEIDVSPERLQRFFIRHDGYYQITEAVREMCIFSRHNMSADPPFSRIDLISCRNVMIYMDGALQKRVIPLLHYALNPDGYLFLGSSENVSVASELFHVADGRHRIFAKSPAASGVPVDFSPGLAMGLPARRAVREEPSPLWNALDVQREADRILLGRFAPVGVVVDETMTVLQFRGRTAAYLEPASGLASLDLFRMLREGLLSEVRSAVAEAKLANSHAVRERMPVDEGAKLRLVRVDVVPFKVPPSGVRFFLILFQDRMPGDQTASVVEVAPPPSPAVGGDERVAQLQQEIASLRDYLQSVIEEQESTNEELKSANEEILSANEELQSTNEELQTAKEEAQSTNEELATVNDELRHRNMELARVNDDLVNLLTGVNIPIIIVSQALRIRRFTPLAERLFNLIPTDVGRPISDIKPNLRVGDLDELIRAVLGSLQPLEQEVQDLAGRWYSLRIRPYVTVDHKIEGASIVLVEFTSIVRPGPAMSPAAGPDAT